MRQSYALLIGVVALSGLVLEGRGLAQASRSDARARVAVVNGEAITLAEVELALAQRPAPLTVPSSAQIRQLRLDALTAMIDDLLLRQFLRANGAKVDAAVIDKQMAALAVSLKAQNKTLADYFRELNQTEAQVRASMTTLMQLDRYVRDHTTEAAMRAYYDANKDFFDRVTVRTSHIVTRLTPEASPIEREKAKEQLRGLRADIVSGKLDFARAAKEHSQCPSAPTGGDIGFIQRKFQNVDEAYAKAAFALKPGEISDVVETEFGCHLIKVTERTEGKPTKYEQLIDEVRDSYAEDLRLSLLGQLRKKAQVTVTLP